MRSSLIVSSLVLGALASPLSLLLDRRQTTDPFPDQCSSTCADTVSLLQKCKDDQCLCTSANINSFARCLQCTVNVLGEVTTFQGTLDDVTSACNSEGFKVPTPTLTGGSGGGSIPTNGGSNSPSVSFSSPAGITSAPAGGSTTRATIPSPTSDDGDNNDGDNNATIPDFTPAAPTQTSSGNNGNTGNSNGGLPNIGGSSGGGALGMGVPQTFMTAILAGVGIAIVL